ncbi:hypothetical protein OG689_00515 [Kitasatospora sp. NBC_00240]|uniref:hypothetical protein n=1 Tax=Kitasatospora sp. NBC_00240 TaxID=2903567 RepID=UPI002251392E|nr:hypothetical protein [Kitasatospora sp. NBC_00240]MCX5207816.1 hypothetical protein [Kitasatospora sp. NBC_00240]
MPLIDPLPPSKAPSAVLAAAALVLTLVGLYLWPWWSSGYHDSTFLEFRQEYADGPALPSPWWNVFYTSWFQYGYLVQTVAVLVLPFAVVRNDRWHWLSLLAVLTCGWQLVGVLGSTIFHTTPAPFLGPLAGVLALVGWALGRRRAPRPA